MNKKFSVGIALLLLSVMLAATSTPVRASPEVVYVEFQPKVIASFIVDSVEYWFWAAVVTASPYGTGNMVIIFKNVSVDACNFSVYVAPENSLLGEKYGWLISLIGNGIIVPMIYTFEGFQSASITIEETETNSTATVSGPISLNITYNPYGENSTFIEDPGDRPYVDDHDGDGFWSNSTRRACTANGSFNGYQLGPTNLNWGHFDITDYEWYDLGIIPARANAEAMREPRSVYIVAEVAVAGAAVTAAAATLASFGLGQSFDSAVSKLPIPDQLKEFLRLYGEKMFETVDKAKLEALEKAPFITKGELAALGASVLIMTIVFGFVEANGLPRFLDPSVLVAVIPSTLLSVCLVSIAGDLSEALCARTCRVYRQFRLWMYGLGAFLISGLLFLFPFASPGITRYQSGEISNKTKGLIVLSKMLVLLTLTIPFAGLFMLGFKIIGDAGLLLTLMTVCYSLVPIKPLAGKAVFDYRKEVSLIVFVSAGILFCSCTVNLLPHVAYLAVGAVSMFLTLITLNQLRKAHPK